MASRRRPRVLLTGATSFLGRRLLDTCESRYEWIAVARSPRPSRASVSVQWIQADLREPLPARLPRSVDAVVHLASMRSPAAGHGPEELFAVNAAAVAALCDYARRAGARRFVLGSTGGVYGYRPGRIFETAPAAPFDAYTLSKWHGETIARHQSCAGHLSVAIIRYFFPYGPGQSAGVVPVLAGRIASGQPVTLHAGGRHPRLNPVFVDDACELTRRVIDARRPLTINCAGPEVASIRQITAIIADLCGAEPCFEPARGTGVGDMVASIDAARRMLRFTPRVGLRAGLRATIVRR